MTHRLIQYGNLDMAYDAYWHATSHKEEQAAYHAILLFGGRDGYPKRTGPALNWIIRSLRRLALWLEGYGHLGPWKIAPPLVIRPSRDCSNVRFE